MRALIFVLLAGCTVPNTRTTEVSFVADIATQDLARPNDLGEAPDLGVMDLSHPDLREPADMYRAPDLTVLPDFTVLPDLTVPVDFTVLPDLVVLPDLTILPDLTVLPDLVVLPPDLVYVCPQGQNCVLALAPGVNQCARAAIDCSMGKPVCKQLGFGGVWPDGTVCDVDMVCDNGVCLCGNRLGQPCCRGTTCNNNLACIDWGGGNICETCGRAGQACCVGGHCALGTSCMGGKCL